MNTQKSLYDQDYFTWLNQNIDLLKNRNFSELDVPNLIEELSDKAKEEKNEIFFNAQAIISYFLKCSVSNDISQEEKSKVTIAKQALSHRIYESPSLEYYEGRRNDGLCTFIKLSKLNQITKQNAKNHIS